MRAVCRNYRFTKKDNYNGAVQYSVHRSQYSVSLQYACPITCPIPTSSAARIIAVHPTRVRCVSVPSGDSNPFHPANMSGTKKDELPAPPRNLARRGQKRRFIDHDGYLKCLPLRFCSHNMVPNPVFEALCEDITVQKKSCEKIMFGIPKIERNAVRSPVRVEKSFVLSDI